jgi:murein DD-endopeptidase MepM/ murein hydrolase activator NlpD
MSFSNVSPATTVATTVPPPTAIISPMTTTTPPEAPAHVFPLDPPEIGDYSPGGHRYPATDIFAPIGTRFVAVTSGTIQGVSLTDTWDPEVNDGATRSGLFVSLIGDDGVRYYGSHLSAVADGIVAGVRVEAGTLLGLVGVSGNARDTPPHLHFGISRPTAVDDWATRRGEIDPVPFLDAWRAGDTTATPEI